MIIFGTYVIHKTLGEGHFMCPQCMGVTAYRVRRGRWFFHILFIPLIPMKKTPPHVECMTCRSKFALGVLGPDAEQYRDGVTPPPLEQMIQPQQSHSAPVMPVAPALPVSPTPAAEVQQDSLAITRAMVAEVLRRADAVTEAGVGSAVGLIRSRGISDVRAEYVRHDITNLDTGYLPGAVRAGVAAGSITPNAARTLVAEATSLARANGGLAPAQWDWIVTFGLDAGIGPTASGEIRDEVLTRG